MELYAVNQGAVNSGSETIGISSLKGGITIGGFSLCNENAGITAVYNNRSHSNKFYDNEFLDGQRLISHLIKEKTLSIDFVLKGESNDELQEKIDEFKAKTSGEKQGWILFTIQVGDDIRALRVIAEDTRFNTDGLVTTVQTGTITLIAVDPPRFYSFTPSTKYYLDISQNFTGQINNNGNAPTYPVYYIVFNQAGGDDPEDTVDEFTLSINGFVLSVSQAITTGDVITIATDPYGLQKEAGVYINNVAIDFDGQLTTALNSSYNGFNNIAWTCNGTYSADFTIIYHQMRE